MYKYINRSGCVRGGGNVQNSKELKNWFSFEQWEKEKFNKKKEIEIFDLNLVRYGTV